MELAKENKIRSIAFCSISTGEYRFPKDEACRIAIKTVQEYFKENVEFFDRIVFDVYEEEDYKIYEQNIRNQEFN